MKSKVLKTAWAIIRLGLASNFSQALRKAWTIIKISLGFGQRISYVKQETGEIREAVALQVGGLDTLQKDFIRYMEQIDGAYKWRSFKVSMML